MKIPQNWAATSYYLFPVIIFFLSILIVNPIGNFPIGDDWQYSFPVKTWIEDGEMEFKGVFAPNVLLQIGLGYLFCEVGGGFDFTWLRLSTLMLAILAVLYFFRIVKQIGVSEKTALFTSIVLLFNPLFYYLSFTFFTDVPFLTICIISIYFFIKYIGSKDNKNIFWAIFWASASFYIRQPGLLLIPAYGIYIILEKRFSKQALLIGLLFILIAFAEYFILEGWVKPMLSIADNFVPVGDQFYTRIIETPFLTGVDLLKISIKLFIYLGFFSLPFFPFFKIDKYFFNKKILGFILLFNIILFIGLFYIGKTFPFGGNIMFNFGLGSELLTDVYTLGLLNTPKLPEWFMLIVQSVSQLSATFLLYLIIKKVKTLSPFHKKLVLFLIIFNLMYLPIMSITSFFDRYLLPTIASFFVILSLFIKIKISRKEVWKFVPLMLFCYFSLFATKDFMAWNRAKNEAFLFLQKSGVSIKEMDAGYEYNGFYNYHFPKEEKEGRSFWWVTDDQYMITFGPVKGYRAIASFPYYRCLCLQDDAILVLKRI